MWTSMLRERLMLNSPAARLVTNGRRKKARCPRSLRLCLAMIFSHRHCCQRDRHRKLPLYLLQKFHPRCRPMLKMMALLHDDRVLLLMLSLADSGSKEQVKM
mmetsp:Transcript_56359/g.132135  ORF Transcript_56359/g.132135 Transcript_56359/m.132135 type:complete len:102 (-) Transcript_56359:7-312(-)